MFSQTGSNPLVCLQVAMQTQLQVPAGAGLDIHVVQHTASCSAAEFLTPEHDRELILKVDLWSAVLLPGPALCCGPAPGGDPIRPGTHKKRVTG